MKFISHRKTLQIEVVAQAFPVHTMCGNQAQSTNHRKV